MTTEKPETATFQALGKYSAPSAPTVDTVQGLLGRFRKLFSKDDNQPYIADDHLQHSTRDMLDEVAAPPACGPLLEELQATLADWVERPAPCDWLKLIVLPPGDENGLVEAWAGKHGHTLLPSPPPDSLVGAQSSDVPDLDGEGVLVIAQLERWFLRHRNGLTLVRALLERLTTLERQCVIGCNSWAWAFLSKAASAHLMLPEGLTFKAFDANRLGTWFSELANDNSLQSITFRLSSSGHDVMAIDDDGDLKQDYFRRLAARSMGIPWVAWHLWRRSLRSDIDPAESEKHVEHAKADAQVLWITALEEFSLPGEPSEVALMVLQALLIHGTLNMQQLRSVLPLVGDANIISTLIKSGIVHQEDGQLSCNPAAYPAVRNGLVTAGLPKDKL